MSSPQPQDDAMTKDADAGLLHRVVIGSASDGLSANTDGMMETLRRVREVFSSRRGSRLVFGPCRDCGRIFGVTPSDAIKAMQGAIVCHDCYPPPLLDKSMVLTDRQLHGLKATRS